VSLEELFEKRNAVLPKNYWWQYVQRDSSWWLYKQQEIGEAVLAEPIAAVREYTLFAIRPDAREKKIMELEKPFIPQTDGNK